MSPDVAFLLSAAGLLLTGLAATGARALAEFSPHEVQEICRRRKSPDRVGQILRHRDQVRLAAETLRVGAAAVLLVAAAFGIWAASAAEEGPRWLLLCGSAAAGALLLLAVEIWLPWAVVRLWGDPFLYYTWPAWRAAAALLYPLVWTALFVDAALHRLANRSHRVPDEESFEDDIRTIVTEGHREGLLEEDAREMIEGVIELGDADVSQIMTPRTDMVSMAKSFSWQEAMEFVAKAGHSRIPVYNKNRDDIVGILYTKDLLPILVHGPGAPAEPWTALLREPYFVPETKPIDVLLQEFQRTRNHIAVVLDEYGGVSGVVSIEDVLEEIVGEIDDEYDEGLVEKIRKLGDGVCEAWGRVRLDEINEELGLQLPEEADFDTIGGFVFHELGHLPVPGEELTWNNVRLTVLEATRRRVERVKIEVLDGKEPPGVEEKGT
jgi:CBS domain containing-hemolysin-like protein